MSVFSTFKSCKDSSLSVSYDCRQTRLISVLDGIITAAAQSASTELEQHLEELLNNILRQTVSENMHMFTIDYLAYEDHRQDHFNICTTIAGIRYKAIRSHSIEDELQLLKKLLLRHISKHDQMFEQYLINGILPINSEKGCSRLGAVLNQVFEFNFR